MKEIGGIPIVISRGTSYEIGLNHGKSHPDRVQRSFEYNLKSCIKESGLSEEELYKVASGFVKPVEKFNPDYISEIQGIADGSGMKFEEVMLLNCRTELQKLCWNKTSKATENCTSIAVTGERTVDGATYVGQNWDN